MDDFDKSVIVERYNERASQFGHGPAALGEPKQRQAFYYSRMLPRSEFQVADSILDIGCGYGDLNIYLRSGGWQGRYCGVDINPELIAEGRRRDPEVDLRVHDIQQATLGENFDWCFACHVITSQTEKIAYLDHLRSMLEGMWCHANKGIFFNLLSPLADYTNPIHARPPFADVISIITGLTNRFSLHHDYMPFEYSICAYKENEVNRDLLIFRRHDATYGEIHAEWLRVPRA